MARAKTATQSAGQPDPAAGTTDPSAVVIPDRLVFGDPGRGKTQRWLPTLAELLAGELREQILDGDIPDGGKLPKQQQLLEEYRVSAPSLREALRILENEGLVTVKRGKVGGAIIHRPTAESVASIVALVLDAHGAPVHEVAGLLELIEPLCVMLCMASDDFERQLLPRLRQELDQVPLDAAGSDAFHHHLVEACGNQSLLLMYEALTSVWTSHTSSEIDAPGARDAGDLASAAHRRLVDLIAGGDADAARRFAAMHLAECGRFALPAAGTGRGERQPSEVSVERLRAVPVPADTDGTANRRSSRVAEVIAADLRRRILRGELSDGGLLDKQRELADVYNVSFPAVREALRILESEGLLTVRRGSIGGSIIRMPRAGNVAHALALVLQSRRTSLQDLVIALQQLEPLCAAACARRADRMTTVVPLVEDAVARERGVLDDPEEFATEAMEFHDILIANSGNFALSLVVGAMQSLWSAQVTALRRISQGLGVIAVTAQRQGVLSEHQDLAELIAAGDADAAEQLARRHFGHAERQPAFTGHGLRVHSSLLRD